MTDKTSTPAYRAADTTAKKRAEDLGLWWARKTPPGHYRPYKVRWTKRELKDGFDTLSFKLVRQEAEQPSAPEFNVRLFDEENYAWPDLPSTAQTASKESPFGFLFLSDDWARDAGVNSSVYAEGGGKFPLAGGRSMQPVGTDEALRARILAAAKDDEQRAKLREALAFIAQVLSQEPNAGG